MGVLIPSSTNKWIVLPRAGVIISIIIIITNLLVLLKPSVAVFIGSDFCTVLCSVFKFCIKDLGLTLVEALSDGIMCTLFCYHISCSFISVFLYLVSFLFGLLLDFKVVRF